MQYFIERIRLQGCDIFEVRGIEGGVVVMNMDGDVSFKSHEEAEAYVKQLKSTPAP